MWDISRGSHRRTSNTGLLFPQFCCGKSLNFLVRCLPFLFAREGSSVFFSRVSREVNLCSITTLSSSTVGHGASKDPRSFEISEIQPPVSTVERFRGSQRSHQTTCAVYILYKCFVLEKSTIIGRQWAGGLFADISPTRHIRSNGLFFVGAASSPQLQ